MVRAKYCTYLLLLDYSLNLYLWYFSLLLLLGFENGIGKSIICFSYTMLALGFII